MIKLDEQVKSLIDRICFVYPDVDKDLLELKAMKLNIAESNDITDSRPMFYDNISNTLRVNYNVLNNDNYDAEYLFATNLFLLTLPYRKELDGIRYGYFSGVASNLVGNFVKETDDELVPGVDPYEQVRSVVQELSSKIGPEKTEELCLSENLEVFHDLYLNAGLENPGSFINQMNYLLLNSLNISEKQNSEITASIKAGITETNMLQKKI